MITGPFHVRHDLTPDLARETLILMLNRDVPLSDDDILRVANEHNLSLGHRQSTGKITAALRDLGLVVSANDGHRHYFKLTELGKHFATVAMQSQLLLVELIHLRYSWLWTCERGGPGFSWAYQYVATTLWEAAPSEVQPDRLVAAVLSAAEHEMGVIASFSRSSVLGIMHWLRSLSPPCMDGSVFRRRTMCSPEALAICLHEIHRVREIPTGVPIRLDPQTRDRICRALLIEVEALDDVLDLADNCIGISRVEIHGVDAVVLDNGSLAMAITQELAG